MIYFESQSTFDVIVMDVYKMILSFKYALKGIKLLFSNENNAKFHLLAAVIILTFGWYFKISNTEWMIILLCIFTVFSSEAFNTAIEKLCDKLSPEHDIKIGHIKDLAAAAVLFMALASFIVACIIFLPKIFIFS